MKPLPKRGRPRQDAAPVRQTIYFRVDDALLAALDAELAALRAARPGATIARVDVVRELLHTALRDRAAQRAAAPGEG